MEKYSEVLGMPLISVEDGKKLGIVKDVIFCPKTKEIKGFLLECKGYEINSKVILLKDVANVGRDAIVVNGVSCITPLHKAESMGDLKDNGKIKGLRVYTKSGDELGIVNDILFDYETGTVEGVEISDGLFQDIVKGRQILPLFGKVEFGEDHLLVDKEALDEMMTTGGGLKRKILGE